MMGREKSCRNTPGEKRQARGNLGLKEKACLVVWVLQKRPPPSQTRNKHRTVNKKEL